MFWWDGCWWEGGESALCTHTMRCPTPRVPSWPPRPPCLKCPWPHFSTFQLKLFQVHPPLPPLSLPHLTQSLGLKRLAALSILREQVDGDWFASMRTRESWANGSLNSSCGKKEREKLPGKSREQLRRWSFGTRWAFWEDQEEGASQKLGPPQFCLTSPSPCSPYQVSPFHQT